MQTRFRQIWGAGPTRSLNSLGVSGAVGKRERLGVGHVVRTGAGPRLPALAS